MICIFCDKENSSVSVEHIVSESLGNKNYLMQIGEVCDACNNKFSKFEDTALSNTVFAMERARLGIESKKGNSAKGKISDLKIEGDPQFRKGFISVTGLSEKNFTEFNPQTGEGNLLVKGFDKSEVAASKLFLKTGLESIYKSQRSIFKKYDFKELKEFLSGINNKEWPFITTKKELSTFKSVPKYNDKYLLQKTPCSLKFSELDNENLLFKFSYGGIDCIINLTKRNLTWIKDYRSVEVSATVYPEQYKAKVEKIYAENK